MLILEQGYEQVNDEVCEERVLMPVVFVVVVVKMRRSWLGIGEGLVGSVRCLLDKDAW